MSKASEATISAELINKIIDAIVAATPPENHWRTIEACKLIAQQWDLENKDEQADG